MSRMTVSSVAVPEMPISLCIVTTSRADYGLLRPLILEAIADPRFKVSVVVAGSHLERRLGFTVTELDADRIPIAARLQIDHGDFSDLAIAFAASETVELVAREVDRISPHYVIVLGDRTEILAVAAAALIVKAPLAHISGGEITTGSLDDKIRHAVSMLASVHFVALEAHRQRLIRMGVPHECIFVVGRLASDAIRATPDMATEDLEALTGIPLSAPLLLVTFHPATASTDNQLSVATALTEALERTPQATVIITGTNSDSGARPIADLMKLWALNHPSRAAYIESLGSRAYLSLMRRSACVVGNSSSGITEAPLLGVPTVNIGDRQAGRERGPTVIDCGTDPDSITEAILRCLTSSGHNSAVGVDSAGRVSETILGHLWRTQASATTSE